MKKLCAFLFLTPTVVFAQTAKPATTDEVLALCAKNEFVAPMSPHAAKMQALVDKNLSPQEKADRDAWGPLCAKARAKKVDEDAARAADDLARAKTLGQ